MERAFEFAAVIFCCCRNVKNDVIQVKNGDALTTSMEKMKFSFKEEEAKIFTGREYLECVLSCSCCLDDNHQGVNLGYLLF